MLASAKDYLENTSLKELGNAEYSPREAIELAKEYIETMRALALTIREEAQKEDCFVLSNLMEDHVTGYDKHLWFLGNMLK